MPPKRTTPAGYQHARGLRKRLTSAEMKLWAYPRARRPHGVIFRRQHAIRPYVVDFRSPRRHLIIELDGSSHLQQQEQDARRSEYLVSKGYRVLRFWNNEVTDNMDDVVAAILAALQLQ